MTRKGSLSLSINAIVVLILAITILGLGLGFIRSQFGGMQKQFTGVSEEIEKELTDKIRTSGEIITFNKINIEAKKGVEDVFYMGIGNPDSADRCVMILFKCVKALSGGTCAATGSNVQIGGQIPILSTTNAAYSTVTPSATTTWFRVFGKVVITAQQVGVYPVYVQIPNANQDTYLVEMNVFKTLAGQACPVVVAGSPNAERTSDWMNDGGAPTAVPPVLAKPLPWQTKQFYVTVK